MASSQSDCKLVININKFYGFLHQIALELTSVDIKSIKFLIQDRVPVTDLENVSDGLDLIDCLTKFGLLSENNLDFFIELLKKSLRQAMAIKVEQYQSDVFQSNTVRCLPERQVTEQLPAPHSQLVRLYFCCSLETFTDSKIRDIQRAICGILQIRPSDVFFITAHNVAPNYLETVFQLHITAEKADRLHVTKHMVDRLQNCAANRDSRLTNLGVQELKVGENSSIILGNNVHSSQNGQHSSHALPRPRIAIDVNSFNQSFHCNDALDIIMAIELPSSVNVHYCSAVVQQCTNGIQHCVGKMYTRLSLISYGRHPLPWQQKISQQKISIIHQTFEQNLNVIEVVKAEGRCGAVGVDVGGNCGTSGIADALEMVCSLVKEIRREATKVCILTCFLGAESSNLEYYKCYHGNDPIKLCHTLAAHGISLYIIGIALPGAYNQHTEENYFLNGITQIGGGRYFEIQDTNLLGSIVECILKETRSIECHMGTVNDIVNEEINKQYGNVNSGHLTRHLQQQLEQRSCKVSRIKQNQSSLRPVSKISERVSWSYDLENAIEGVRNMTITHPEPFPEPQPRIASFITDTVQQNSDGVDLDISSRMVRRQIQRYPDNKPPTD